VVSLETMKKNVNDIGYDLIIDTGQSVEMIEHNAYRILKHKTILSWILAILLMSISMKWLPLGSTNFSNQVSLLLCAADLWLCGRQFYVTAWKQLVHASANMDTLVALSTAISFLFSTYNTFWGEQTWGARGIEWHTYFDAAVMIITFVLTGRLLEEKARESTASSIRQLMGMESKTARIVETDEDGRKRLSVKSRSLPFLREISWKSVPERKSLWMER
jgi:Cu2+-exporting ATPase